MIDWFLVSNWVTISILKGLICGQKYLQQKDYYTSCKSFSIRFWKFVYSISLFKFIFKYTSCQLTKQHFIEMWNLHSDTYTGLTKPILGFGIGHVVTILALPHFFYLKVEEIHNTLKMFFLGLQRFLCTCEMHFMLLQRLYYTKVQIRFETFSIAFNNLIQKSNSLTEHLGEFCICCLMKL